MVGDLKLKPLAIGSLPCNNVQEAIEVVRNDFSEIPFFPQLINVQKKEDMIIQYLEGMPSFFTDKPEIYAPNTQSDEFYLNLEEFFTDYEEIITDTNSEKLNKYGISREFSSTFDEFINIIKITKPKYAKGQVVGTFTLATSLTDINKIPFIFDDVLREVVVKLLCLKSIWIIKQIKKANYDTIPIIFTDEPALSQLGTSAYLSVSKDSVKNMLKDISDTIKNNGGISGIHCCGKCDWSIPIDVGFDIINPDAYSFAQHFSLYGSDIEKFLNNGGKIAWGIVPTLDVKSLKNTNAEKLVQIFENSVKYLTNKGIDEKLIKENSLITSSCGASSLPVDYAKRAMDLVKEVSDILRERIV